MYTYLTYGWRRSPFLAHPGWSFSSIFDCVVLCMAQSLQASPAGASAAAGEAKGGRVQAPTVVRSPSFLFSLSIAPRSVQHHPNNPLLREGRPGERESNLYLSEKTWRRRSAVVWCGAVRYVESSQTNKTLVAASPSLSPSHPSCPWCLTRRHDRDGEHDYQHLPPGHPPSTLKSKST